MFCGRQSVAEGTSRRPAFHAASLVRALGIVDDEIVVENHLHFLDGFKPGLAPLDAEVLVEKRAVEALDDAVRLRALDKVIAPDHSQAVFSHFYYLSGLSPSLLQGIGFLQMAIIAAFAAGFARLWTYGAVLLMHAASTASTYPHLVRPWAEGSQLLFWAAVPVLAALIGLFLLRDRDRLLSIDAARSG